ncbi:MAG TPA: protein kinase family protein [Planktothrix sp.]|jgi:serine/threonine protein kinase
MSATEMVDQKDSKTPDEKKSDLTWLGLLVGDYAIDEVIEDGRFARIYHGRAKDGEQRAFKVASTVSAVAGRQTEDTQVLRQITGGFLPARPDTADLLEREAKRIKDNAHPNLVQVDAFCALSLPYYQMEFIEGTTLRQVLQEGRVKLKVFLDIARAMSQLLRDTSFTYHGDLKPENIIIRHDGSIKFIDPGYFGRLLDESGNTFTALVTTPMYYPYMKPDDVFALGLIMWEAAFGRNPLANRISTDEISCDHVEDDLLKRVQQYEFVGNFNLSALLTIDDPLMARPDLSAETRAFLLKAVRMRGGAKLGFDSGFQTMAQLAGALITLQEHGVESF